MSPLTLQRWRRCPDWGEVSKVWSWDKADEWLTSLAWWGQSDTDWDSQDNPGETSVGTHLENINNCQLLSIMKIVQQVDEQLVSIRHCEREMFQFGEWTGKKLIANYFVFSSPEQIYVGPVGQEVWGEKGDTLSWSQTTACISQDNAPVSSSVFSPSLQLLNPWNVMTPEGRKWEICW